MAAIRSHKAAVAAGFKAKLRSELRAGETAPDLTLALELTGRSVETAIDELVRADQRYTAQGVERRGLNKACIHVARDETYPELVDVRRAIEARFGREEGRHLHRMEGHTRRKPKRQHPQLEGLVIALRERKKLPKAIRPGPPGERQGWLRQLEPGFKKLTRMLDQLDDAERLEEALREDRDYELEAFDATYSEALDFVRAAFRVAGRGTKVIWALLPTVQRRRLKGKARRESEARAEGRRDKKPKSADE